LHDKETTISAWCDSLTELVTDLCKAAKSATDHLNS